MKNGRVWAILSVSLILVGLVWAMWGQLGARSAPEPEVRHAMATIDTVLAKVDSLLHPPVNPLDTIPAEE